MNQRKLLIAIGVFILLVLMTIAIFSAVGGRKLTLTADPAINTVTIDGKSTVFKQGMQVDYKQAITIEVAQNGYAAFKVTLDPTTDNIKDYAIKLTKNTNTPVGSQNYGLLQAAQNDPSGYGLTDNSQLSVTVTSTKPFADGYTLYTVDSLGGPALVVVRKQGNTANIVLGPGSHFDGVDLARMPSDVATYLRSIGVGGDAQ